MKESKTQPGPALEPAAPPVAITSLSQLEQLSHGAPVIVDVPLRGQVVRFTGRRLRPVESKEVKILLESALPPLVPSTKEGEPVRYDYRDAGYLRRVEENRRRARALALHAAFPVFAEAQPPGIGPVDADRIVERIETCNVDDDVLETLFRKVIERVVDASALVGFS